MHPILHDVRLVAFDLDGTLIDSVPDLAAAVDRTLSDLGLPVAGEAAVRDWVGNGSRTLVERALRHADEGGDGDRARFDVDDAHARFLAHYRAAPCRATRVFDGVVEALDALKGRGVTLALITNKPEAFIAPILEALGLDGYFAYALGGDSLAQKKPHPLPLLKIAARGGVGVEHCLMVGDSRHDIEAGRRAGFRTLAVPSGYNHGEPVCASGPDALVESLRELV